MEDAKKEISKEEVSFAQKIEIFFDKFHDGRPLHEASRGRFYVLYADGQRSRNMYYSNALTYAEVFHGTVYHVETHSEVITPRWI